MMLLLHCLLPFFVLLLNRSEEFTLNKDIEKDQQLLSSGFVYINDNTTSSPSMETVAKDLQLFQVAGFISTDGAAHSSSTQGRHTINKWQFTEGNIQAIYQVESTIALDTVVTQQYLDGKPPTQQRITNGFTFRTYVVATDSAPLQLLYMTEADQGLLEYRIERRKVGVGYSKKKEGLNEILPVFTAEIENLLKRL